MIRSRPDAHDLKALYHVLETAVIPTYYNTPDQWRRMMQSSIKAAKEPFAVKRMLEEYYNLLYTE